jgi:hypothetical protein
MILIIGGSGVIKNAKRDLPYTAEDIITIIIVMIIIINMHLFNIPRLRNNNIDLQR